MSYGLDVGSIYAHVNANVTGFMAGMAAVDARLMRTAAKFEAVGKRMMVAITLPLAGISYAATRRFAAFDDAMTKSTAIISNMTRQMREDMERLAISLSQEGVQSAEELARSYFYLASAGLNVEQSIGALPIMQRFATAGAFDMASATDLLTDAQSALGLTVQDTAQNIDNMTRVANVLVKANVLANASTEQFSKAITSMAGPAMKAFKIDIEEGTAVLAAFADQGIKAEYAGNMFSRMLRLMTKGFDDNRSAWAYLNIDIYNSERNLRSISDIIDDLTQHFSKLSVEQMQMELSMLGFEARSAQAILPLLGMGNAIRRYEQELRGAAGTIDEVSERQLMSLSSQLRIVKNRLDAVGISIGRILAERVAIAGDMLARMAETWHNLNDTTQRHIISIGLWSAAVGPLLWATGKLLGTFKTLIVVLKSVSVALMGPVGGVLVLAGLAYTLRAAWKQGVEGVRDNVKWMVSGITDALNYLANTVIGKFVQYMYDTFIVAFEEIRKGAVGFFGDLSGIFSAASALIRGDDWAQAYVQGFDAVTGKFKEWKKDITNTWEVLKQDVFPGIAPAIGEQLQEVFDAVRAQLDEDFGGLIDKVQATISAMVMVPTEERFDEQMSEADRVMAVQKEKFQQMMREQMVTLSEQMKAADSYIAMQKDMTELTSGYIDARIAKLEYEKIQHQMNTMDMAAVNKWYAEQIKRLQIEQGIRGDNAWVGFHAGVERAIMNLKTLGEVAADISDTFVNEITNGIYEAASGTMKWNEVLLNVLRTMGRIASQELIKQAVLSGMSAAFGNYGGGAGAGNGNTAAAAVQHAGGVVGVEASSIRQVPTSTFYHAVRAHNGLMSDEVPIIARKDESVLTPAQMKALGTRGVSDSLLSEILDVLKKRQNINATVVDNRDVVTRRQLEGSEGEKMVMWHVGRNQE